jgi:hypothetical protein
MTRVESTTTVVVMPVQVGKINICNKKITVLVIPVLYVLLVDLRATHFSYLIGLHLNIKQYLHSLERLALASLLSNSFAVKRPWQMRSHVL